MSILTKIKDDKEHLSIKYFGEDDWGSSYSLKVMLSNSNVILNYFDSKTDFRIKNFNDFVDYIFIEEQIKYFDILPVIIDEKKKEVEDYLNKIKLIFDRYLNKDVIYYLNNHYSIIFKVQKLRYNCTSFEEFNKKYAFDTHQYDIEEVALNLIAQYISGITESTMNYIVKYYLPEIYNKMDLFYAYIETNHKKFLSKKNIQRCVVNSNYGMNRIEDIAEILIKLNNKKIVIKEYLDNYIELLKENYFASNDDNLFLSHQIIQGLIPYLSKLQTSYYNDFVKEEKKQQERISNWLETKGQKFEYSVDLKPVIDLFDADDFFMINVLILTHGTNKETKKLESIFSTIPNMPKALTDDLFSSNIETNDYFSNSFLRNMSMQNNITIQLLHRILCDRKRFNRLFDGLNAFINEISKELNISVKDEKLDTDFNIIVYYLNKLFLEETNDIETNALLYGCISFMCGEIEKLLRIVYLNQNSNIYIRDSMTTLGNLLNFDNKNNTLLEILGYDNMRCLSYYLINDRDNDRIGLNIRNEIDHLNFNKTKLDREICILVVELYINVINCMFIYYCK